MALKNNWNDLVDGESFVEVEPINRIAHAVIENEENISNVQELVESTQSNNESQEARINELSEDLIRLKNDSARLDSKTNENEKRITNLEKGIPSDLFLTDSSIAYSKNVPQNALPYAEVKNIGGMTYKDGGTLRSAPVTEVESVGVNLWSEGGNITATTSKQLYIYIPAGTYTLSLVANSTDTDADACRVLVHDVNGKQYFWGCARDIRTSNTFTFTSDVLRIEFYASTSSGASTGDTATFSDIMLNRGTTALPYRPYTRHTLPIPEAVQALDGYGDGVNESVYNYIDFEKKQFVKRVGKVVFDGSADENWVVRQYTNLVAFLENEKFGLIPNRVLCDRFESFIDMSPQPNGTVGVAVEGLSTTARTFFFGVSGIATNVAGWRAYLAANPITVYYELATPVVTDISDLLPEDNFIGVEGNGTITMTNQYKYNVPSEIVFMLNEV